MLDGVLKVSILNICFAVSKENVHSEEECEEKLAELIREMKIEIEKLKHGG